MDFQSSIGNNYGFAEREALVCLLPKVNFVSDAVSVATKEAELKYFNGPNLESV